MANKTDLTKPEKTVAERVQAGIEWLDANTDYSWRATFYQHNAWHFLRMRNPCECVFGIVFSYTVPHGSKGESGFKHGESLMIAQGLKPRDYGFDSDKRFGREHSQKDYDALQAEWIRRIKNKTL